MPDVPPSTTFTVLGGSLKGKRLAVDDPVDEILIGSDSGCRFCLELPGVSPLHARVWLDPQGATVHDTHSPRGVYVNDTRVEGQAPLADGDVVWLGPPGDPQSVMIQFRHAAAPAKAAVARPLPAAPATGPPAQPPAPSVDSDEGVLDSLFEAPPRPPAPSSGPNSAADLLEEFVYDEPAAAPPISAAGDAPVEFLVDEPAAPAVDLTPAAALPPAAAPPPAAKVEDDLFFVDESAAAPQAPVTRAPTTSTPAAPASAPPAAVPATAAPVASARPSAAVPAPSPPPRPASAPAAPSRPVARPAGAPSPGPAPAAAARPRRAAMPRAEPAPAPHPARAPRRGRVSGRVLAVGAVGVALVITGGLVGLRFLAGPAIQSIEPGRVRAGDTITVIGRNFSTDAGRMLVKFEGSRTGRIVGASATRLQVEVPEVPAVPGRPNNVPVTVTVDGRESEPMDISVYQAPRVHGLSPSVAMPGEDVVLVGTGWGPGASVTFGGRDGEVLEVTGASIKVRVPPLEGPPGTSAPVVVTMGGESSNPAPFLMGRLPLVLAAEPRAAAPGDVVVLSGRGFHIRAGANDVRIGGTRALVVSSIDSEMRVLVPWVPAGAEVPLDVKVPGSDTVGQTNLAINPPADPVEFRFSAEPLADAPDHDHAVMSTGLGPAFVLSAAGGRSAADRAQEAVRRLNEAAAALKASLSQDIEMRGLDLGSPALVLTGKGETLLEITEEDAAGYSEDWTGLRGRGGPVTRGRLAVWWGAVARDLVLLLVRWDRPVHAAALAPEGRALADLYAAGRNTGRFGVPRAVVENARPALRQALRTIALRVPATVIATSGPSAAPAPSGQPAAPLRLDGEWTGREVEEGTARHVNVTFSDTGGSLSYQRALTLTLPLTGVEIDRRGTVRYSMQTARGARYYVGRWDGQTIEGRIFADPESQTPIGTFSLQRAR